MDARQMKQAHIPLTKSMLAKMRMKALRIGVWFRALNRLERASMDLTIRVVERVRSLDLAKMLVPIVEKLSEAMENKVVRVMREVGCSLARKTSQIAEEWGNKSAMKWKTDRGFIRYLAIMRINASPMFNE